MRVALISVFCLLSLITIAHADTRFCDPRKFGAKADGVTKDTAAIQQAIDVCSAAGARLATANKRQPGDAKEGEPLMWPHVVLAAGTFVSGPLQLKSNIVFSIRKGATLLGSPDREDYPPAQFAGKTTVMPLLGAVNQSNIRITGAGTVDGNGHVWWEYVQGVKDSGVLGNDHPRPMGLVFDHSSHIRVSGITVQNAGFWQIVPYYAEDVSFRHIRILAPKSPNTDAIDPWSSSNIVIDHVFSSVGDDNIAIKSGAIDSPGPDAPSTNITITDCTFERGHGLSIGSEIAGGAQNIRAERIHFNGTEQGIRIKANRDRGHDVSNIRFKDIDMVDVKTAILISEYYPAAYPQGDVAAEPVQRLTPVFHDIRIENVKATGSNVAGIIVGLPESHVRDLTLKNVTISAKTGLKIAYAEVAFNKVKVNAKEGEAIIVAPTATVTGR